MYMAGAVPYSAQQPTVYTLGDTDKSVFYDEVQVHVTITTGKRLQTEVCSAKWKK